MQPCKGHARPSNMSRGRHIESVASAPAHALAHLMPPECLSFEGVTHVRKGMRAALRHGTAGAQKYRALMNFLSNVLREDGGFEYKKAIVDSILILIREIPDAKESGLSHLCEFIEVRLPLDAVV